MWRVIKRMYEASRSTSIMSIIEIDDSLSSTQQVVEVVCACKRSRFRQRAECQWDLQRDGTKSALFEKPTKQPAGGNAVINGYGLSKSKLAVDHRAIATGIPQKTRGQTQWSVRTWGKWAVHRNMKLTSTAALKLI